MGSKGGYGRFLPRMATEWWARDEVTRHRSLDGSLVFADISGFTALSERLASLGREGAEVLTEHIDAIFADLLGGPSASGGDLLSFGGDALVLWFEGESHARLATAAAAEMRATVRRIGRRETPKGNVRLRISIGVHSGTVEALLVGDSHRELLVTGPAITTLVEAEGAASAGQILVSAATAEFLPAGCIGDAVGPGFLLKRAPSAPSSWLEPLEDAPADLLPVTLHDELAGGGQPPEHRLVSVAFLHLQGVDALVSDASALTDSVDTAVAIVQRHLDEHAVTFLSSDVYDDGFKIIAVAGAPTSRGDDEERLLRAVQAAISDPDLPLPVRAGAHRGTAFVGAVGAPHRATYTVMGDTVNTAARVMSRAEPGQLLATPVILDRSATTFVATPIEPFKAKGKAKPLEASIVGPPAGVRARELARLPLVGRDTERKQLIEAWDTAAAGRGVKVDVVGEAGAGKSRLIVEIIAAARDGGATVMQVQSEPYQQATAHFVTGLLLRRLGDDDPLVLDGVEAEELNRSLVSRLSVALGTTRRLVVIEDGEWIDDASLEVLNLIDVASQPVTVVLARRPEGAPLDGATVIEVGALPDESIVSIVAATRGRRGILPDRLQAVTSLAGGNPLYAIELALSTDDEVLPDTVEAAVTSRLDRLPPERRARLRELSVLGTRFDVSLAEHFLDNPGALKNLEEHIAFTEVSGRFRSSVERDAAYNGLAYRRRRGLHHRAADLIAEASSDPDDVAELLSHHYHEAGASRQAFRFARVAAQRAEAILFFSASAIHFDRAVQAARALPDVPDEERADVIRGFIVGSRYTGNVEDAFAAERELNRLQVTIPMRVRIAEIMMEMAFDMGDFARALRLARRGIRVSEEQSQDPTVARHRLLLLMGQAMNLMKLGRLKAALPVARQMVLEADALGDDRSRARALALQGTVESDLAEATTLADAAAALYETLGQRGGAAVVLTNHANRLLNAGNTAEAEARYVRAAAHLEAEGEQMFLAMVRGNLVQVLIDRGEWTEASALADDLVPVFEAAQLAPALVTTLSHVARLKALSGATTDADAALVRVLELIEGGDGDVFDRLETLDACLLLGRGAEFDELLESHPATDVSLALRRLELAQAFRSIQLGREPATLLGDVLRKAKAGNHGQVAAAALAGLGRVDEARAKLREERIARVAVPPRRPGDPIEVVEAEAPTEA